MDYLEIRDLYHHGIKGQKWGVRRFQNEDGTLTAEGKERYNKGGEGRGIKELNDVAGECNKSDVLKKAKCKITVNKDNANDPDSCETCWTVLDDKGKPIEFNGSTSLWYQEVGSVLWDRLGNPDTGSELYKQINSVTSKLDKAERKQWEMLNPEDAKRKAEFDKLISETNKHLAHYGITGQKWGMRRFQNKDGTLTEEGKKRYGVSSDGKMSKEGRKQYSKDVSDSESSQIELLNQAKNLTNTTADLARERRRGSKVVNNKDYSKLSDDELRKKVNRMSLERQYAELNGDNKYVMTGREKVNEVLRDIGDIIGVVGGIASMALIIKHLRSK